jgi:hypothetical protein
VAERGPAVAGSGPAAERGPAVAEPGRVVAPRPAAEPRPEAEPGPEAEPRPEAEPGPAAPPERPRPAPGGGARRSRRWIIALTAALVLLLAVPAVLLALKTEGSGRGRTPAGPGTTGSPAATGTSAAGTPAGVPGAGGTNAGGSASGGPGPAGPGSGGTVSGTNAGTYSGRLPALPAGWRDYHDPTGFAVYVPAGWRRSKEGSIVYFRSAGRVLGIDQTNHPQWDPVADWRGKATYRVHRGDFPGYHEIHIVEVRYFRKAADWEFTFDGSVRQHVNNRGFVVSNHQAYGIYWQTSDADWARARPDLQLVFDSFRPAS